jgi:hypothetical protein
MLYDFAARYSGRLYTVAQICCWSCVILRIFEAPASGIFTTTAFRSRP